MIVDDERSYVDLLAQMLLDNLDCDVHAFTRADAALLALPAIDVGVVVTRPRGQSAGMMARLRDLGAWPLECPAIAIESPASFDGLDAAIAHLRDYDWLVFTSANGVRAFFERLDASRHDLRELRARIAVIGPATRDAVEQAHLKIDVMGDEYVAENLVKALSAYSLSGERVLVARAAVARDLLPGELQRMGARVEVVEAYKTVAAPGFAERASRIVANPPEWMTFTSSSTVDHFFGAIDPASVRDSRAASIGPVTSGTLRKYGIEPAAEASLYTMDGLVDAIRRVSIIGT